MGTPWRASGRRRSVLRLVPVALIAAIAFSPSALADQPPGTPVDDPLDPIIDNGSFVQLGINPAGNLNVGGGTLSMPSSSTTNVGLRYIPTNGEATAPGCLCEGWGIANADAATGAFSGYANVAVDGVVNLAVQAGTGVYMAGGQIKAESVGTHFRSITTSSGRIKVTQDYHPSSSPNLYEVKVTMENIGATPIGDLRYRRVMDWDIAPFTFSEWSEIHVGTSTALVRATSDGFLSGNPLNMSGPYVGVPPTTLFSGSPDYFAGPYDQGASFDFKFGTLIPGQTKSFRIFYGAAGNRTAALAAIASVGGEMYSLGLPRLSSGAVSPDGPHAFIFAFAGVGGDPIGDISLAPLAATNNVGTSHTVTATVKDGQTPIVGKTVTFTVVSGPNTGLTGTDVTDANGEATFTYTSTLVGIDEIEARFTDDLGNIQTSNRVTKEWLVPPDADISVTKTDDADPVDIGNDVTYTVTVSNAGPANTTNVTMTDALPAGATFVSATSSQGSCGPPSGGLLTCSLGAIAAGGSATVQITVHPTALGTLIDKAHAEADEPDPDLTNNGDDETTEVVDRQAPAALCFETTNPSGKNVPTSGPNAGKSGQNPDGFYRLLGGDNVAVASIVVRDSGSSFVSGPFANDSRVKITQAPGVTPSDNRPGPGVIVSHLKLKGDGILRVTDTSGNVTEVWCRVAPPPK